MRCGDRSDELGFLQDHDQHPDDLGGLNGIVIPLIWMVLPAAGNSNTSERNALLDRLPRHSRTPRSQRSWAIASLLAMRGWPFYNARNPFHPASAREPSSYARLRRPADFSHRTASQSRDKMIVKGCCRLGRQTRLCPRPCARPDTSRLSRALGLGLFQLSASRARRISPTVDHQIHVRQSQEQSFALEAPTSPTRQTLHLARTLAFAVALSVKTVSRCTRSSFPSKNRTPRSLTVRSRPPHPPQNLRRRKSRSNNRLPRQLLSPKLPIKPLLSLAFR